MLSARQIDREARRVLRLLLQRNGCLKRGTASGPLGAVWHFHSPNGARKKGLTGVEEDVALALLERGLLVLKGEGHAEMSRPGLEWITARAGTDAGLRAELPNHVDRDMAVIETEDGAAHAVLVNRAESPLAWLSKRRDRAGRALITPHQLAAGERLREDYEKAGLRQHVTARWDCAAPKTTRRSRVGYREGSASDAAIDARARFYDALDAAGPELAPLLVDVCCLLHGLEAVERRRDWPRRSAKLVLQIALSALARHYGMIPGEPARRTARSQASAA
jgi:hypothetical protein